jgi:uncharacterized protein (DUF4213/DUF364 family)
MNVIDDLIAAAIPPGRDQPLQEVLIGLHWSAVHSRRLGLAATLHEASCCRTTDIHAAGELHRKTAFELVEYLRSNRPLEASLGLAALNSLLPVDNFDAIGSNARDLLIDQAQGRRVALVGHFPFSEHLRRAARQLWVLELDPGPGDEPAENAPEILPQADVIGLTGSTLANHTFESLAVWFPPQALVVMLGPSTPLSPVLFDYRVDVLAGAVVDDPDSVLRSISQGATLHRPTGLRRITLLRDPVCLRVPAHA